MKEINLTDIHSPADIKGMDLDTLRALAGSMRAALLKFLSAHGGHVGPNLGMIEATVALHYVFDAPNDKIVFDVSHQCYPHKMLTGRMLAYTDPAHYYDVTGFTDPKESPTYDLFSIGHTSTALALASGLAKARDIEGGKENVVAVVGDGSLGGGEALEGLNFGSTLGTNFIVVVNDNDMSIAENHGALYSDLRLLRNTNGEGSPNIFRSLGYDYLYVHYGNDLRSLIEAFESVKNSPRPVVVHINTMKGMGLAVAEANKEAFHFHAPFDLADGAPLRQPAAGTAPEDYTTIFADHMLELMRSNPRLALLNAGTPGTIGFTPERRREAGNRFIDVGIAEQMCTGMAAGMAKNGMRPVMGVVGTFLQRAYDQLSQDVAINGLPAVFAIFFGGVYAMNSETHLGFFDISMVTNIPGIKFLAPTCAEEYVAMLDWAIGQTAQPVAVRTPGGAVVHRNVELLADYSTPRFEVVKQGSRVALIGAGTFFTNMAEAAKLLEADGIEATLINPRCLSALDTETLDTLAGYDIVITAEDGTADGGFGQKVAAYLAPTGTKVRVLGLPKEFPNMFKAADLLTACSLTPAQIASIAKEAVKK